VTRFVQRVAVVLFACALLTVALLSLLPASQVPAISLWDKAQHAAAYVTLGLIGGLGFTPGVGLIAGLGLIGGVLEIAQHFTPGRSPSLLDEVTNILGAAAGVGLAKLLRFQMQRRSRTS
jgi:VanZ family protein